MSDWEKRLAQIQQLRHDDKQNDDLLYRSKLRLHQARNEQLKARKEETVFSRDRNNREEEGRNSREFPEEYERAKKTFADHRDKLHTAVSGLYTDANGRDLHPKHLVDNLDDRVPFLLLPVRLETRFIHTNQQNELWLRVYPDDIAVHTHEKTLTAKEVEEGKKYWEHLLNAEAADAPGKEKMKKEAWSYLAGLFAPQRAAWVAQSTKPLNWGTVDDAEGLVFPEHDLTKNDSWSRAARTQVMPDRFVVMLYQGDTIVKEVVGSIIPDELQVGPDPLEAEAAFEQTDGLLQFGKELNWSSDFQKAVDVGMGFKIPLTADQAVNGFSKVLVLGLYLSADERETKQVIESLIENHHYAQKGFSLVKQGTATNNTDDSESGYTKSDPFHDTSYFVETGQPLFTDTDETDGRNLADALGIDYASLQFVQHSDGKDYSEAVAMNKVLYPGTLGYYFDAMLPVLREEDEDQLRDFFTRHVTGRGPIPAIRIGNQPYGILLTSDFENWKWSRGETGFGQAFVERLYTIIKKYHAVWQGLLDKINFIGKPGTESNPNATLMNILGLQPGSVAFYQRIAYSTEFLSTLDQFKYGGRYYNDIAKNFQSKAEGMKFLNGLGYKDDIPQLLRLVYQHYHTSLNPSNLVDGVPLSETERIRYYDEAAEKNYLNWLAEATSDTILERQDFGAVPPPNALLYLMARRALLLQLHKASVRWFGRNNIDLKDTLKPANFHNIMPQPTLTKWETMKAKVELAQPRHAFRNMAVAEFLLTKAHDEEEAAFLGEIKKALQDLSKLPTARLERCFTEHLDCCSYRLDAWQTGLFHLRLKNQREAAPGPESEKKQGSYLGAFGWVENLKPSPRKIVSENIPKKLRPAAGESLFEYDDNNGFTHAPSLNHATAASLLRSGYVSHARSDHPEMMAVNLSSERVRRALFILDGIRNGQKLEALLGYQFERGLHDAGSADSTLLKLNEYIYDFRDQFPLDLHYIQQEGAGLATEAIPANNVVNGLKLAEATGDTPYGARGSVKNASEAEKNIIRIQKNKLSDSLDAVKDLLMSESVYQLVLGNFDRSGAVINALKDANVPPEIEILETPRGTQLGFTNRVTIQFAPGDPGNPWPLVKRTKRANMEPGLNHWLGKVLGLPEEIFVRVAQLDEQENELGPELVTIDKLQLQPIDLVYIAGHELNTGVAQPNEENRSGASELESRIAYHYREQKGLDRSARVRIQFLKPEPKKTLGKLLPLLRNLKGLITDSRPLHALDFDPPSKESLEIADNPKGYDVTELENRVLQQFNLYQNQLTILDGLAIDATVKDADGNDQSFLNLETSFEALKKAQLGWADVPFNFGAAEALILKDTLVAISETGLAGSFPGSHQHSSSADQVLLLEQAMITSFRMKEAIAKASVLLGGIAALPSEDQKIEQLVQAGKLLLGDVFVVLPRFRYNNEADILKSHADRTQLLKYATDDLEMDFPPEEWLQNAAHVRPRLSRWNYVLSLYEYYNKKRLLLQPVQVPYRAMDSWLSVAFPEKDPNEPDKAFQILHDTLSITIHGEAAFIPATPKCGLLVDEWPETIPLESEMTGIGFHYNTPNAAPPQTILLAVTPEEKGKWNWDTLVGILNDTLQRAKLRAVEPDLLDTVNQAEVGVLLPAILSDFSQTDLNIALDYRLNHDVLSLNHAIKNVHAVHQ